MQSELDVLLARTEESIAKLKDQLRVEELLRERLMEIKGQMRASPPIRMLLPSATHVFHEAAETGQKSHDGHKTSVAIVNGSLMSHMVAVLEEEGRGMKAREIAERVKARGYDTDAKGGLPVAVSTSLAHGQGKVFQKVGYGVYDLKSRHEAAPLLEGGLS